MPDWRIPLSDLDYGVEEEAAVLRVLKNNWISMGPEVLTFEREFAKFLGIKHAIALTNCTAALNLSYMGLGFRAGDEIIQPAINFVSAANMTVAVGATPVFADILSLDEPTIDPSDIEHRITKNTKAVVVMHYGGYPARMADISNICKKHNLALIEDACHAIGARYNDSNGRHPNNLMVGNLGDIACFSFFSNKNLATGEGGMIVTNQDDLAGRLRLLRSHGMTTQTWDRHQRGHASSYNVVSHGNNFRFDELRAALGRCQLQKLNQKNSLRRELVLVYRRKLAALEGWIIPFNDYQGDSAYHLMVVLPPNEKDRLQAEEAMNKAGIQTSLHYPSIPDFSAFNWLKATGLEISKSFARRVITLPLFPRMTTEQVKEICSFLCKAARNKPIRMPAKKLK